MAGNVTKNFATSGTAPAAFEEKDDLALLQQVKIDIGTTAERKLVSSSNPMPVADAAYATRIDEGATYMYLGYASPGADESAAVWRIGRFTLANVSGMMWADGDVAFDNVWDDRASLVYE